MIQMKAIFTATLLALCNFVYAQQNTEFKEIKDYFDSQKSLLKTEFQKKYLAENNPLKKDKIKADYKDFVQKIDSVKNVAYLGALIRVKNTEDLKKVVHHPEVKMDNQEVEKPEFPNGINSLREKVAELFYADGICCDDKELNTTLKFVVEKDGSISDVKVLRGIGGGCDEEAVRVVKSMPTWKPGKQRGQPVRVYYTLPIDFKLM